MHSYRAFRARFVALRLSCCCRSHLATLARSRTTTMFHTGLVQANQIHLIYVVVHERPGYLGYKSTQAPGLGVKYKPECKDLRLEGVEHPCERERSDSSTVPREKSRSIPGPWQRYRPCVSVRILTAIALGTLRSKFPVELQGMPAQSRARSLANIRCGTPSSFERMDTRLSTMILKRSRAETT